MCLATCLMSTLHLMKAVRVKMNLCKYISECSGVNYFVLISHVSVWNLVPTVRITSSRVVVHGSTTYSW